LAWKEVFEWYIYLWEYLKRALAYVVIEMLSEQEKVIVMEWV